MWWQTLAQAVPPAEFLGLPGWMINGLSIGSLVMFIVVGLATSKLWTKSQVDNLIARYEKTVEDQKARYEMHLQRTIELYQGRVDDATRREYEWRETSLTWQKTATTLSESLAVVQEQSATSLGILQAWQLASRHDPGRRGTGHDHTAG